MKRPEAYLPRLTDAPLAVEGCTKTSQRANDRDRVLAVRPDEYVEVAGGTDDTMRRERVGTDDDEVTPRARKLLQEVDEVFVRDGSAHAGRTRMPGAS